MENYKYAYAELAYTLSSLGCQVCDYDFLGFANFTKGFKGFVYVSPKLNYKEKYLTLAHEAGHLFFMKAGKKFNWSKKARSEEQANWFAIQLLRINGIDVEEYKKFYNKAIKRNKNRKKSWIEF